MKHSPHIAIIGAGPSGLMAAQILASSGCGVTIYDQMPSPARKFLIAGRGGLNLTHSEPLERFLLRYGDAADFLAPAIHAFPPDALRAWSDALGQETFVGSSGRVFPRQMKAVTLLRAWLRHLEQLGVRYVPKHRWCGWERTSLLFRTQSGSPLTFEPDATLLAMGGASWPRLGSDGGWVDILTSAGVKVNPLKPSNSGFVVKWSEYFSTHFAGTPLKSIAISHEGHVIQGEAMLTAQGIEGGAIYALSGKLRDAIDAHGQTELSIDLRPQMTQEALTKKLQSPRGNKSLSTFLRGAGFAPVAVALLRESLSAEQLAQANAGTLAAQIKSLPITLTATSGMARAISSAGGIAFDALTSDWMIKAKPGVFAAGEMLDWEAPTGGYLLQACFSTAVAAAHGILHYCASKA